MEELKPTHSMPGQSESASWTIPLSINWKQPKVVPHWQLRCNSFELFTSSNLTKCKKPTDKNTSPSLPVAERQENSVIKPDASKCATDQAAKEFSALKTAPSTAVKVSVRCLTNHLNYMIVGCYCVTFLLVGTIFTVLLPFSFVIKWPQAGNQSEK